LATAGGNTTTITDGYIIDGAPRDEHIDNYADEWARFMHDDMGVIFYAVDVDPAPIPDGNANGIGNSALLRSLSQGVGGGKYFRVDSADPNDVSVTIGNILQEIQAENSVFSSVALPASTTGQSVFLNQVFIGLFRPDEFAYPRWPGNLKQYQLGLDSGKIKLFDARGTAPEDATINTSTGFITDCARSFWTDPDPDEYWYFSPAGTCLPATDGDPSKSDSPDGPYVEKGGQSHVMRSAVPTDRTVFTCDYTLTNCTDFTAFDPNTITGSSYETLLNADDPNDLEGLVNWAIGVDLDDDNGDLDTTDTRAWIHGDVIHSRPIAINYGDDDSPEVVVYYGANDGMLRAINGNQSGDIGAYEPGEEFWAFMPPEFYGEIKRLRVNTETVKFPATGPAPGSSGTRKAYGMDGAITAFAGDAVVGGSPETDLTYIYATMRRGGRALYAFDVSDPSDPADLLWKKGCDATGCSTDTDPNSKGWNDIGQTWSDANVAYLTGRTNPVLIMGGGYDECEDTDNGSGNENHSCVPADNGDHIYVLDAITGDLLAVHDTLRAVPGNVTLVPITDATPANPTPGLAFAYATDTGGNVYRISGPLVDDDSDTSTPGNATVIGSSLPHTWAVTRIAALGCGPDADDTCDANRKFLFGPDVVRDLVNPAMFRILVGSGDREKPILVYSATQDVENYFYSFVDLPLAASDWMDVDGTCALDVFCHDLMEEVTVLEVVTQAGREVQIVIPDGVDIAAAKGYKIDLATTEQVVTGTLVVGDIANFSTHVPYDVSKDDDGDACLNRLGTATTYNIDFQDAEGEGIDIYTGGLVPSPVAGLVELCEGDVCTKQPFCIGCGGENSPIGGGRASTGLDFEQSKGKVYWNIEQ
jgi:type IV pilus assembly protein PilY1